MEYADPTEYRVAMALLGSFDHWKRLCGLPWFKPHVDRWRAELSARIQSEAVAKTQEIAKGTGTAALAASKWIAVRGWEGVPSKRGRPAKHEVTKEAKRLAEQQRDVKEDAVRIGLKVG